MNATVHALKEDEGTPATGEPPRTVAGTFDITLNLSQTRGIKMTGYVYSDDDQKTINGRMDAFQDALERQAVRVDLVVKEAQIASNLAAMEAIKSHCMGLVSLKESGGKLATTQKEALLKQEPQLRMLEQQNESLRAAIAEGRKKLAE